MPEDLELDPMTGLIKEPTKHLLENYGTSNQPYSKGSGLYETGIRGENEIKTYTDNAVNFEYGRNYQKERAENQGIGKELLNKSINLIPEIVLGTLEGVGYLGTGAYEGVKYMAGGTFEPKNALSDFARKSQESYRKALGTEIYHKSDNLLDIGDSAWWTDYALGLIPSVVSFGGQGRLAATLLKGMGVGGRAGQALTGTALAFEEGVMEASDVFDKSYYKAIKEGKSHEEAVMYASEGAATTAQLSTLMNSFLNYTSLSPVFKSDKVLPKKFDIGAKETLSEFGDRISKETYTPSIQRTLKSSLKEIPQEALEEINTGFAASEGERVSDQLRKGEAKSVWDSLTNNKNGDFMSRYGSYATSQKGMFEGLLGALGGAGNTMVMQGISNKTGGEGSAKENAAAFNKKVSQLLENTKYFDVINRSAEVNSNIATIKAAQAKGDNDMVKYGHAKLLSNMYFNNASNGTLSYLTDLQDKLWENAGEQGIDLDHTQFQNKKKENEELLNTYDGIYNRLSKEHGDLYEHGEAGKKVLKDLFNTEVDLHYATNNKAAKAQELKTAADNFKSTQIVSSNYGQEYNDLVRIKAAKEKLENIKKEGTKLHHEDTLKFVDGQISQISNKIKDLEQANPTLVNDANKEAKDVNNFSYGQDFLNAIDNHVGALDTYQNSLERHKKMKASKKDALSKYVKEAEVKQKEKEEDLVADQRQSEATVQQSNAKQKQDTVSKARENSKTGNVTVGEDILDPDTGEIAKVVNLYSAPADENSPAEQYDSITEIPVEKYASTFVTFNGKQVSLENLLSGLKAQEENIQAQELVSSQEEIIPAIEIQPAETVEKQVTKRQVNLANNVNELSLISTPNNFGLKGGTVVRQVKTLTPTEIYVNSYEGFNKGDKVKVKYTRNNYGVLNVSLVDTKGNEVPLAMPDDYFGKGNPGAYFATKQIFEYVNTLLQSKNEEVIDKINQAKEAGIIKALSPQVTISSEIKRFATIPNILGHYFYKQKPASYTKEDEETYKSNKLRNENARNILKTLIFFLENFEDFKLKDMNNKVISVERKQEIFNYLKSFINSCEIYEKLDVKNTEAIIKGKSTGSLSKNPSIGETNTVKCSEEIKAKHEENVSKLKLSILNNLNHNENSRSCEFVFIDENGKLNRHHRGTANNNRTNLQSVIDDKVLLIKDAIEYANSTNSEGKRYTKYALLVDSPIKNEYGNPTKTLISLVPKNIDDLQIPDSIKHLITTDIKGNVIINFKELFELENPNQEYKEFIVNNVLSLENFFPEIYKDSSNKLRFNFFHNVSVEVDFSSIHSGENQSLIPVVKEITLLDLTEEEKEDIAEEENLAELVTSPIIETLVPQNDSNVILVKTPVTELVPTFNNALVDLIPNNTKEDEIAFTQLKQLLPSLKGVTIPRNLYSATSAEVPETPIKKKKGIKDYFIRGLDKFDLKNVGALVYFGMFQNQIGKIEEYFPQFIKALELHRTILENYKNSQESEKEKKEYLFDNGILIDDATIDTTIEKINAITSNKEKVLSHCKKALKKQIKNIEESFEDTDTNKNVQTSYDGAIFVNDLDRSSATFKALLSSIPIRKKNSLGEHVEVAGFLGMKSFVDGTVAYNTVQSELADTLPNDVEQKLYTLASEENASPIIVSAYLALEKLKNQDIKNKTKLVNDFCQQVSKHKADFRFVRIFRNDKDKIYKTEVIASNRNFKDAIYPIAQRIVTKEIQDLLNNPKLTLENLIYNTVFSTGDVVYDIPDKHAQEITRIVYNLTKNKKKDTVLRNIITQFKQPLNAKGLKAVTDSSILKNQIAPIALEGKLQLSFENTEGNRIYGIIQTSYLTNLIASLRQGNKIEKTTINKARLIGNDTDYFSCEWLREKDGAYTVAKDLKVVLFDATVNESPNDSKVSSLSKMSVKNKVATAFSLFLNNGTKGSLSTGKSLYFTPTLSDKEQGFLIEAPRYNFTLTSENKAENINTLNHFVAIAKGEFERIMECYRQTIAFKNEPHKLDKSYHGKVNDSNNITKVGAGMLFTFFPELNQLIINNPNSFFPPDTNLDTEVLWKENLENIKKIVKDSLIKQVADATNALKGRVDDAMLGNRGTPERQYPHLEAAIESFTLNDIFAKMNMQMISFDVAYAGKKAIELENIHDSNSWSKSIMTILKNVYDNTTKRLASFIAPGLQGKYENPNYTTAFLNDLEVVSKLKREYFQNDYIANAYLTNPTNVTDAQEWTSLQEDFAVKKAHGKLNNAQIEFYQKLIREEELIDKLNDSDLTLLEEEELSNLTKEIDAEFDKNIDFVMQPTKPVYVGNTVEYLEKNGQRHSTLNKMYYIKSSSIPLIHRLTSGLEIDNLRKEMVSKKIDRVAFESAVKLGLNQTENNIFDSKDGEYSIKGSNLIDNNTIRTLQRKNFRIQQDIPYDQTKKAVVFGTQIKKLIVGNIVPTDNFIVGNKALNGTDFKKEYQKTLQELINLNFAKILRKHDIVENEYGRLEFTPKGKEKFDAFLRTEMEDRGFPISDILGLELNEQGNYNVPLWLNTNPLKTEGLIVNTLKNLFKFKLPGRSFVQATSAGFKLLDSDILANKKINNDIIWTEKREPNKELGFIEKGETQNKVAEILIPASFLKSQFDDKFDIKDFLTDEGYLDLTKIDPKCLEVFQYRIPTPALSAALPMKIVGILPDYMGDIAIVPKEITTQQGSDFDVDKIYVHWKNVYNYNGKIKVVDKLPHEDTSEPNKTQRTEKYLENHLLDMMLSVVKNPDYYERVTNITSTSEIEDAIQKLNLDEQHTSIVNANKYAFFNVLNQWKKHSDAVNGKQGTAIFAKTITTFVTMQELNMTLAPGFNATFELPDGRVIEEDLDDNNSVNKASHAQRKSTDLFRLDKIYGFDVNGKVDKNRLISNTIGQILQSSVDNTKLQFNEHLSFGTQTFPILSLLTLQGIPVEYTGAILNQSVIKELIDNFEFTKEGLQQLLINKGILIKKDNKFIPIDGLKSVIPAYEILSNNMSNTSITRQYNEKDFLYAVYTLFNTASSIASLNDVTGLDSKGIGKNLFEANSKISSFRNINKTSKAIEGTENINYTLDGFMYDLSQNYLSIFNNSNYTISNDALIQNLGKFIKLEDKISSSSYKKLLGGLRTLYGIYAVNNGYFAEYFGRDYKTFRLNNFNLVNSEGITSLEDTKKRINEAKERNPNNAFLNSLIVTTYDRTVTVGEESVIRTLPIIKLANYIEKENAEITMSFQELFNGSEEDVKLAKRLLLYTIVSGNWSGHGNIGSFVPVDELYKMNYFDVIQNVHGVLKYSPDYQLMGDYKVDKESITNLKQLAAIVNTFSNSVFDIQNQFDTVFNSIKEELITDEEREKAYLEKIANKEAEVRKVIEKGNLTDIVSYYFSKYDSNSGNFFLEKEGIPRLIEDLSKVSNISEGYKRLLNFVKPFLIKGNLPNEIKLHHTFRTHYSKTENKIYIGKTNSNEHFVGVLIHELVHSTLDNSIDAYVNKNSNNPILKNIHEALDYLSDNLENDNASNILGITKEETAILKNSHLLQKNDKNVPLDVRLHELIAGLFNPTNKGSIIETELKAIEILKKIKYKENESIWDSIMNFLKDLLGLSKGTYHTYLLEQSIKLLDKPDNNQSPQEESKTDILNAPLSQEAQNLINQALNNFEEDNEPIDTIDEGEGLLQKEELPEAPELIRRKKELQKIIRKLVKDNKNSETKSFKEELNLVTGQIKGLELAIERNQIIDIIDKSLNRIKTILDTEKEEINAEKLNLYKLYLSTYKDITGLGDFQDSDNSTFDTEKLKSMFTLYSDVSNKINNLTNALHKNKYKALTGKELAEEQDKKAQHFLRSTVLDSSKSTYDSVQYVDLMIQQANDLVTRKLNDFQDELKEKTLAFEQYQKSRGIKPANYYDIFEQVNSKGKKTGNFVMPIKEEYYEKKHKAYHAGELSKFIINNDSNFQAHYDEFLEELKKRKDIIIGSGVTGDSLDSENEKLAIWKFDNNPNNFLLALENKLFKDIKNNQDFVAGKTVNVISNGVGRSLKFKGWKYVKSSPNPDKWGDTKYKEISQNQEILDFYNYFTEKLKEFRELLPYTQNFDGGNLPANYLPEIQQSLVEKNGIFSSTWITGAVKNSQNALLNAFTKDIERTNDYLLKDPSTGEIIDTIPVRFMANRLAADEKSNNIANVLQVFGAFAINYDAMQAIAPYAEIAKTVVKEETSKNKDTFALKQLDSLLKSMIYQKPQEESKIKVKQLKNNEKPLKELKVLIDKLWEKPLKNLKSNAAKDYVEKLEKSSTDIIAKMDAEFKGKNRTEELDKLAKELLDVYSGQYKFEKIIKEFLERDEKFIEVGKTADTINNWGTVVSLAVNLPSAFINLLGGQANNLVHAAGGEDYGFKDIVNATGKLTDLRQKTKIDLLARKFNIFNKTNTTLMGKTNISENFINANEGLTGVALIAHQSGEYFLQNQLMIAMLLNKKIKDVKGKNKNLYDAFKVETTKVGGKTVSRLVWDTENYGEEPTNITDKLGLQIREVRNTIHGNYDITSPTQISRYWWGRLLQKYRKWIAPAVNARLGGELFNERLGRNTEGRYVTAASAYWKNASERGNNSILFAVGNVLKDIATGYNSLDLEEHQKANMRKNRAELIYIMTVAGLGFLCAGMAGMWEKDKKKKWYAYLVANMFKRWKDESQFHVNPFSTLQIIKDPIPATQTVLGTLKIFNLLGTKLINPEEDITKTGVNKGESKFLRELFRNLPGFNAYERFDSLVEQEYKDKAK